MFVFYPEDGDSIFLRIVGGLSQNVRLQIQEYSVIHKPLRFTDIYIHVDLGEIGWSGVDWIGLAQDRNR
jgi:hypothetical protein